MIMNKQHLSLIFALLLFCLTGCAIAGEEQPAGDEPTATPMANDAPGLPPEAVLNAQRWLAEQLNVPVEQVTIVEMAQMEWSDSCLGLGGPAESCAAVITPGWRAIMEVNGQRYEVRTNETGSFIRSPQVTAAADVDLANTQWALNSFGPLTDVRPVLDGTTLTLEFEAGNQAGGEGGCNSFGTGYEVEGNTLTFEQVTSTLRACAEEARNDQEQRYLAALQSAGTFAVTEDGRLTIWYDGGHAVLNFVSR